MDRVPSYIAPQASVSFYKEDALCLSGNIEQWYEDDIA